MLLPDRQETNLSDKMLLNHVIHLASPALNTECKSIVQVIVLTVHSNSVLMYY